MKGMKGDGLSWMVSVPLLVFVGMFVLAMIGGFYIRTLVAGPPIQVTTYTEYRWMNYLPSAALFALTYSPSTDTSPAWQALNAIALYDSPITPVIIKRSELSDYFSSIAEVDSSGFSELDTRLKVVEESLNEGSLVQREFTVVKDSSGVVLAYGMNKLLSDVKAGKSGLIAFPEDYPYKCSQKEMPVFSGKAGQENLRVKMVICCQGIKKCSDYISQAGSGQCEADECSVGPCRIIHPVGEERQCTQNEPPNVGFGIIKGTIPTDEKNVKWQTGEQNMPYEKDLLISYKIAVRDDSTIKAISIDWDDGLPETILLKGSTVSEETGPASSDGLTYIGVTGEAAGTDVKFSTVRGTHTYANAGEYTITCKVWDERAEPVQKKIKLKITQ